MRSQPLNVHGPTFPPPGDASLQVFDGFRILPGNLSTWYYEMREYLGPGGIPIESESHEQSVRLGRDLRNHRPNSTNRYSLTSMTIYSDAIVEVRSTERGSRYYLSKPTGGVCQLAPGRLPLEFWKLLGPYDNPSDGTRMTLILVDSDGDGLFSGNERIMGTFQQQYSETPPESMNFLLVNFEFYLTFRSVIEGNSSLPEAGSVIRIYQSVYPTSEDVYIVRPMEASLPAPEGIMLFNNFPNPFNPTTTIKFYLPSKSRVLVTVYNLLGAEVAVLLDEEREAGVQYAFWMGKNGEGRGVASGIYFYRVSTPSMSAVGKMILVR